MIQGNRQTREYEHSDSGQARPGFANRLVHDLVTDALMRPLLHLPVSARASSLGLFCLYRQTIPGRMGRLGRPRAHSRANFPGEVAVLCLASHALVTPRTRLEHRRPSVVRADIVCHDVAAPSRGTIRPCVETPGRALKMVAHSGGWSTRQR